MNLISTTNLLDQKLQAYNVMDHILCVSNVFEYFDKDEQKILWAGTPDVSGTNFKFRAMYGFDNKEEAVDYIISQTLLISY